MASETHLQAFLEGQLKLLLKEREAEIERSSLILSSCGPKLLEDQGLALGGLGIVGINIGLGGKSLIEFERPSAYHTSPVFPPHTFRPGDLARIDEHVSGSAVKNTVNSSKKITNSASKEVEGVVYKVSSTRIIIAVEHGDSSDDLNIPERCRLLKLANTVTFDRMDRAIENLMRLVVPSTAPATKNRENSNATLNPLVQVLLGIIPPSPKIPYTELKFNDASLNDSQKQAVRFAMEAPEVALIHGPPGTGKTHTLIEIIRQFVSQGKRVLVCGASNLAVDNLLERLLPHNIPVTRLGHPARVLPALHAQTLDAQTSRSEENALAQDVKTDIESAMAALSGKGKGRLKGPERRKMWDEVKELRKEYRKREGQVVKRVMSQAKVVLATCHSAGGRQLLNTFFDVAVIDEATQALEAVCWIPILKAKKLILAGDPLQLPPTIMSTNEKRTRKTSLKSQTKKPSASRGVVKKADKTSPKPSAPAKAVVALSKNGNGTDDESSSTLDDSDSDDADKAPEKKSKPITKAEKSRRQGELRPSRSLEVTLFDRLERMHGPDIKRMLTVQYRMHSRIASFPSDTLYSSALVSHDSVASHLLKDLPGVSEDANTVSDVLELPVVFFDTSGCEYYERLEGDDKSRAANDEGSRCNENEAVLVKSWVEKLVQAGVLASQVAVITPYQAQVALLASLLRPSMPELEIGTVDGMQGREKEAIVLSLVRSNDKREVGFLKEKRRLNVAMTRPRRHLCVIGDSSTVSQGSRYLKNWMEWLEANADVRFGEIE